MRSFVASHAVLLYQLVLEEDDVNIYEIFQIEREKADLSVQVIQLSERLEEAEGGAESQVNKQTIHVILGLN